MSTAYDRLIPPLHRGSAVVLIALLLSACGAHGYHQVRRGETLYSISFSYGRDYRDVARWNDIAAPYVIHQGELLRVVPPPPGQRARATAATSSPPAPATAAASPPAARDNAPQTPPATAKQTAAKAASAAGHGAARDNEPAFPDKVSWQWPARGRIMHTFLPSDPARKGIDIAGNRGEPVYAAAAGKVVYSGQGLPRYGNLVIIKHNDDWLSAYAHNDRLLVNEGAFVKVRDIIARMGASGSDHVMLHFEIRHRGKPVNPVRYLPKKR